MKKKKKKKPSWLSFLRMWQGCSSSPSSEKRHNLYPDNMLTSRKRCHVSVSWLMNTHTHWQLPGHQLMSFMTLKWTSCKGNTRKRALRFSSSESRIKQAALKKKGMEEVVRAFLRCLSNKGGCKPSHSTSCFIGRSLSVNFLLLLLLLLLSGLLRSCPITPHPARSGSQPGPRSVVVAMATSPPCHFGLCSPQVHGGVRWKGRSQKGFFEILLTRQSA